MSEERFRVGDVVVLNGHRLTVEPSWEAPKGHVWLSPNPAFGAGLVGIPEVLLPDPEPREEPAWRQGDWVLCSTADAPGRGWTCCYQRDGMGGWRYGDTSVPNGHVENRNPVLVARGGFPIDVGGVRGTSRPATEGDTEGAVTSSGPATPDPNPDDYRDTWDTFGTKRGAVMAETASSVQYMPDPYVCQRPVPDGGLADSGRRCGKRNPCPDHAGTYHSEGGLEALARAVPTLTPGHPVAHRDGRFGTYTAVGTGLAVSSALWRPFGELDSEYVNAADLRPVTLIERPDRDNALALMCPRIHSGRREQVLSSCIAEDIYTALFGPGEPS